MFFRQISGNPKFRVNILRTSAKTPLKINRTVYSLADSDSAANVRRV